MKRWHNEEKKYRHPYYRMSRKQITELIKKEKERGLKQDLHFEYELGRHPIDFSFSWLNPTVTKLGWERDNIKLGGLLDFVNAKDIKYKQLKNLCNIVIK